MAALLAAACGLWPAAEPAMVSAQEMQLAWQFPQWQSEVGDYRSAFERWQYWSGVGHGTLWDPLQAAADSLASQATAGLPMQPGAADIEVAAVQAPVLEIETGAIAVPPPPRGTRPGEVPAPAEMVAVPSEPPPGPTTVAEPSPLPVAPDQGPYAARSASGSAVVERQAAVETTVARDSSGATLTSSAGQAEKPAATAPPPHNPGERTKLRKDDDDDDKPARRAKARAAPPARSATGNTPGQPASPKFDWQPILQQGS